MLYVHRGQRYVKQASERSFALLNFGTPRRNRQAQLSRKSTGRSKCSLAALAVVKLESAEMPAAVLGGAPAPHRLFVEEIHDLPRKEPWVLHMDGVSAVGDQ
jgi:hypothetical protein